MKSLGTKTSIRLLKALFEDPLYKFKEIELIKKAKTGKGSASDSIKHLIKENVVLEKRVGKAKIISLNLQNKNTFLLKQLFDQEKLNVLSETRRAAILLLKSQIKEYTDLIMVFGSSVAGTATDKSDIDLLIISNTLNNINKEKGNVEDIFGVKFHLHHYTRMEAAVKNKTDPFVMNTLLNGIVIQGSDFRSELFSTQRDLKRLFFFRERIKSAQRNFINKDYTTTKEILDKTVEQIIYYLLSNNKINYTSKMDAKDSIKKIPEGKMLKKIHNATIKYKLRIIEELILDMITGTILEDEGYGT
tara:strand:+ start:3234 stop:4142 length:909 start_codon:yes stop_codon:yes gene_type:complete